MMMARRIIGHRSKRFLQRARPLDPRTGVVASSDEDNERSDPSAVDARVAGHERGAGVRSRILSSTPASAARRAT